MTPARERADLRSPTTIERLLVWAIRLQKADMIVEAAQRQYTREWQGISQTAAVCSILARGCFIDGGGGDVASSALHPDAERVYTMMRVVLTDPVRFILVRDNARADSQPTWNPFPVVEARPELTDKGKVRVYRVPMAGVIHEFCRFTYLDRAPEIEQYRILWLDWWAGVRDMETAIRADKPLERWKLVPWTVPQEPWRARA
ncbi:MAG: hypothetical protein VW405_00755 [Rhodospirillaceae bacterium]